MDKVQEAHKIYSSDLKRAEKIRLFEEFILDSVNELEAQDQNMHPELHHKTSEGLRIAKNYLRTLKNQ